MYLKKSERTKDELCSINMNENKAIHEIHNVGLIQYLDVDFVDLYTAKKEINKNVINAFFILITTNQT